MAFSFSKEDGDFDYIFGVNPLGEVQRNGESLLGGVSIGEAVKTQGTESEVIKWKNHHLPEKRESELVEMEYEALARTYLTPQEYLVYKKIGVLQVVDDGRWRIYGGLLGRYDGKVVESINLVTEFQAFVDQEDFWESVEEYAAQHGAEIRLMHESPHLDKSWPAGQPEKAVCGENHGRLERQVEVIWEVAGMSLEQVRDLIEKHNATTDELWTKAGVGVC